MALPMLKGRVAWIFAEDDFDIDLIVGIKNIKLQDAEALATVAMQRYEADFRSQVQPGDLLVGGRNFGYGHPHYPAMKAMRHMGIRGVIAESFSPGYWRGEVAMGFPQLACPGVLAQVKRWDELEVDWAAGRVLNHTQGLSLSFEGLAQADQRMLEAGGLFNWLQTELSCS
jgi:3-isopropylmalate/(R)-2-methylmalate dehydratase small subunit